MHTTSGVYAEAPAASLRDSKDGVQRGRCIAMAMHGSTLLAIVANASPCSLVCRPRT